MPLASNAEAARQAADGQVDAALAGAFAAGRYGLAVIAPDVHDRASAVTRFVVVSPPGPLPARTGADRSSVAAFLAEDHPGALLEILTEFAVRGIDSLENRPLTWHDAGLPSDALRQVVPIDAHQYFHRVPGPHGDRHNVPGQRQWRGFGILQARLTGLGQSGEHAVDVVHTERVGSRTREPDRVRRVRHPGQHLQPRPVCHIDHAFDSVIGRPWPLAPQPERADVHADRVQAHVRGGGDAVVAREVQPGDQAKRHPGDRVLAILRDHQQARIEGRDEKPAPFLVLAKGLGDERGDARCGGSVASSMTVFASMLTATPVGSAAITSSNRRIP